MSLKANAVFYNMVTNIVTKQVVIDISPTDSDDNVRLSLKQHQSPGEGIVFIPHHQMGDVATYLNQLGISLTA